MEIKARKKPTIWQQLLKIILIVATSLATSQVATTNPLLDSAVKSAIVGTSNVLIEALSSDSKDTAIIIQAKSDCLQIPAKQSN